MFDKKKGTVDLIMAKLMPKKDPEEESESSSEESDEQEMYKSAAEEVIQAIKDEDASALSEAMQSFVSLCMDKESGEEFSSDKEE